MKHSLAIAHSHPSPVLGFTVGINFSLTGGTNHFLLPGFIGAVACAISFLLVFFMMGETAPVRKPAMLSGHVACILTSRCLAQDIKTKGKTEPVKEVAQPLLSPDQRVGDSADASVEASESDPQRQWQ